MDKPWKVVFAFLGVFIAGAVFGGLLALRVDRTVSERRLQEQAAVQAAALAAKSPGQPAPAQAQQRPPAPALPVPQAVQSAQLMRRVTNQLNLTPAQRAQVTPLIQRAVQDFWRETQNYNRENLFLTQRLKQDIAKELTPEQQTRLDDLWLKQLEILRTRQAEARVQARPPNEPPPPNAALPSHPPPGGETKPSASGTQPKSPASGNN